MNQDSNQAVYFQCQLCGECCSSWNIPIEAEKAEALLQKPWVQERLQETGRQLQRQSESMYRIPLTDENVCVFLGADRRCLVEVHEGLALKPHECQRFPFATVKAPNGATIHDTSAACKSVSEKLLLAFRPIQPRPVDQTRGQTPVETQRQAPEQASGPAHTSLAAPSLPEGQSECRLDRTPEEWLADVQTMPARVWQTLFRQTDWESLQRLRAEWKDWFQSEDCTADQALSRVQASLTAQRSNTGRPTSTRMPWGWAGRQQTLLVYFLRKPYQSFSLFQLLSGELYHDPRLFGEPLPLKDMGRVRWSPEGERLLKAFVYNLLTRNRLLASGGSAQALVAMAGVAIGLARWYARSLAVLQHAEATTPSGVATAIRLVERYYTGHQPRFFQFFQSRLRGWLVLRWLYLF
ncbi:YkgJ family cysteine cluster protein [Vampirovibrio chlorellavorus]|uniref:YkgJ family cysteine cluster protein n=1 Tax=Vampirovibrio chlorellavorus TaxID=758823 RepID=UPI0026EE332F|nr:YkgJ family cysteine cluster protein [Vampirovibrio chlorellavorus]